MLAMASSPKGDCGNRCNPGCGGADERRGGKVVSGCEQNAVAGAARDCSREGPTATDLVLRNCPPAKFSAATPVRGNCSGGRGVFPRSYPLHGEKNFGFVAPR